jgi:hypothetical protein
MYSCLYGIRNFVLLICFESSHCVVHWAIFASIVEDMQCVCRLGVIVPDVSNVLLVT